MSKLDSLLSLNNAFVTNANIFNDVMNFEQKSHHSPNFGKVMQWLEQSIKMQQCVDRSCIESQLYLTFGNYALMIKAQITKQCCVISKIDREKVTNAL